MPADDFATGSLPKNQQFEAWRGWYDTVFDVAQPAGHDSFIASNSIWTAGGFALSCVASPSNTVSRTKSIIRHNPVDHWSLTLSKETVSDVTTGGQSFQVPPTTPFIVSLGEEITIGRRQQDTRVQLLLARDRFQAIAPVVDAATGMALNSAGAQMLADYIVLLEKNIGALDGLETDRLSSAVEAMLVACLAPTADRQLAARHQIRFTLMERVRRAVRRNLRSHSLGVGKICREAATSRSQLYRLLEQHGGVARYIQRQRLSESFSMLCDPQNNHSVSLVADFLCFSDPSSFSRAFRREFGMSPSDVREATYVGLPPVQPEKFPLRARARTFNDCLRGY